MISLCAFRALPFMLLATAFLAAACGTREEGKPVEEPPVVVSVVETKTRAVSRGIETVGTLIPDDEVVVSAEVDGALSRVLVDEGDAVRKDEPLAEVDDTDFRLRLQQAEANYAQTKAELARKEVLFREAMVSQQQYDGVKARFALAEAQRSLTQQRLRKTRILAPLDSRVKARKVSAGEYVHPGMPLFVLIRTHPLKLVTAVPEKHAARVRKGQRVRLRVDAHPGRIFKGRISLVAPHVEETTRTLKIEARIPNPGEILKPGLFARSVVVLKAEDQALLIPAVAVQRNEETLRVFVVVDDTAREVHVKVGERFGPDLEIIQGLKPGDRVVVAGHQALADGIRVQVKP